MSQIQTLQQVLSPTTTGTLRTLEGGSVNLASFNVVSSVPATDGVAINGTSGNDILGGWIYPDTLWGHAGNDELYGHDGNDTLTGGDHADRLDGGDGFDIAKYDDATEGLVINLNNTWWSSGIAQGDVYTSIEGILGSNYADTFYGNAAVNELYGGAGDDRIYGFDGADVLTGSLGNDRLNGGNAADRLFGEDDDDVLEGGADNDTLYGGAGNDTLDGGAGNDTLDGGLGSDTVSYASLTTGSVTVLLNESRGETSLGEVDAFLGIQHAIGSEGNDRLVGTSTANVLDGRGGTDTLEGGAGGDTYIVTQGDKIIEAADGGIDTIYTSSGYGLGDHLENLHATGAEHIVLAGNALANRIYGNSGNNFLDGRTGQSDTLAGGKGDDSYFYNQHGDVILELAGEGHDTIYISPQSFVLQASAEIEVLTALDATAHAITGNGYKQTITGSGGNDTLDGGGGGDRLDGSYNGNDTYRIRHMSDVIVDDAGSLDIAEVYTSSYALGTDVGVEILKVGAGYTGNVSLAGNNLANTIIGNAAKNVLNGSTGDDTLTGGYGNDTLYGGTGRDVFVFDAKLSKKTNIDRIADFKSVDDTFRLDNAIFKKLGRGSAEAPGTLNKAFFRVGSKAKDKNDYLIYDKTKGTLSYDADGSGKGAAIVFAQFSKSLKTMSYLDFQII